MNEENFKNEWKYCSVKNLRGQEWYIPSDCAACVPLSKVFGSATQRPRGMHFGNRSKAPGKKPPRQKPPGQKPPDNKPPRIIEVIITKYAFDAYLFRLGSTDPKKNPAPGFFLAFIPGAYCRGVFDLDSWTLNLTPACCNIWLEFTTQCFESCAKMILNFTCIITRMMNLWCYHVELMYYQDVERCWSLGWLYTWSFN